MQPVSQTISSPIVFLINYIVALNPMLYAKDFFIEFKERLEKENIVLDDGKNQNSFENAIISYAREIMESNYKNNMDAKDNEFEVTYSNNEPYVTKKCFCLYFCLCLCVFRCS